MMTHLSIDDVIIPVRISRRVRHPSLKSKNTPPYGVELVIPEDCHHLDDFKPFARKHLSWIKKHQQNIPMLLPFVDGMPIVVLGDSCTISHVSSLKITPYIENNILFIGGSVEHLNRRVQDYLKTLAKTRLVSKTEDYCEKFGVFHQGLLRIGDMNTRWGSCNLRTGKITLNWRLVLAPSSVFDHVVAHEVVHLRVPGHGKDFYQALHQLDPSTQESRNWLKKHGNQLFLYGRS